MPFESAAGEDDEMDFPVPWKRGRKSIVKVRVDVQ